MNLSTKTQKTKNELSFQITLALTPQKGLFAKSDVIKTTHILNELGIRQHEEVIEDIMQTTMCRFGLLN